MFQSASIPLDGIPGFISVSLFNGPVVFLPLSWARILQLHCRKTAPEVDGNQRKLDFFGPFSFPFLFSVCYLLVLAKRPQELGLDVAEEDGIDWNCTQTTKGKRRSGGRGFWGWFLSDAIAFQFTEVTQCGIWGRNNLNQRKAFQI